MRRPRTPLNMLIALFMGKGMSSEQASEKARFEMLPSSGTNFNGGHPKHKRWKKMRAAGVYKRPFFK